MFKMIKIIGTSHIAKQSIEEVKAAITAEKPDILALELDRNRFYALTTKRQGSSRVAITELGLKGYLFYILGSWLQRHLGRAVGISPGAEMKLAVKLASKYNIKIALIDQDIRVTLRKLSARIRWREKLNFMLDILKAVFFGKKMMKKMGLERIDLSRVPTDELIEKLIAPLKQRYPATYYTLVEERNRIMARNLVELSLREPEAKILAIVGAGHKKGLSNELSRLLSSEPLVAG